MCRNRKATLDTKALRDTLGHFPTGVAVVTTAPEGLTPAGMTINSFQAISLEPALVGWCIDRRAASYQTFRRCGQFTLSFLDERQQSTAQRFATRGEDKFAGLKAKNSAGAVIPGACAWLQCRLYRQVSLGDHLMLVGEVTDFGKCGGRPLVFARGQFGCITAGIPTAAATDALRSVPSAA